MPLGKQKHGTLGWLELETIVAGNLGELESLCLLLDISGGSHKLEL